MNKNPIIKNPVPVTWSTDIDAIPRGKFVTRKRRGKGGKDIDVAEWERDELWVVATAVHNGERQTVVNRTYWIPSQNRWCMYGQDPEIHAWAYSLPLTKFDAPPGMPELATLTPKE